jgi:hypothetical protein
MRHVRWLLLLLVLAIPGTPFREVPDLGPSPCITGQVRDHEGPIAGARVSWQGDRNAVLTDADGRFVLPAPGGTGRRIVAWKCGYFIAGAPADRSPLVLTLEPLPAKDCEQYSWVDPTPDPAGQHNCANCHGEIYREWKSSGHARAATGRHFRNLYEGTDWHGRRNVGWSLLAEHKDGAGVCTSCHAPTVAFSDPAYFDLRQVKGVDAQGVHCDYCHKIQEASTDGIPLTHGRFGLTLLRPEKGQLFFGPLPDVDRGDDAFAPLYRESRYCASCHEGTVFGVHVYSTYSEWLESPARRQGQQCQSCHMAPTGRMTNIAPGKGGIERDPATLGNHRFFAGSRAAMLRDCLHLTASFTPGGQALRAEVELTAKGVGHRVPTGFIDRNLLLIVEPLDGAGQPLRCQEGPVLPALAGDAAGLPGRLYARVIRDFDGHSPAPFWRAQPETVDTRLQPRRPDRSVFTFPTATTEVRLRLIHRRFWHEVARIKSWPDNESVVVDQRVKVQAGGVVRWSGP